MNKKCPLTPDGVCIGKDCLSHSERQHIQRKADKKRVVKSGMFSKVEEIHLCLRETYLESRCRLFDVNLGSTLEKEPIDIWGVPRALVPYYSAGALELVS